MKDFLKVFKVKQIVLVKHIHLCDLKFSFRMQARLPPPERLSQDCIRFRDFLDNTGLHTLRLISQNHSVELLESPNRDI